MLPDLSLKELRDLPKRYQSTFSKLMLSGEFREKYRDNLLKIIHSSPKDEERKPEDIMDSDSVSVKSLVFLKVASG